MCDIAILVVDIMHGLEPQTLESINLLKEKKCRFIVALNKIDRLYDWKKSPETDVVTTLKKQKKNTKDEFDERAKAVIVEFAQQVWKMEFLLYITLEANTTMPVPACRIIVSRTKRRD